MKFENNIKIKKVQLTPAKCAVDLGDGSERGLYVNQDYILDKLNRPHRAINLMYCYYPLDKTWPKRASECDTEKQATFAWDYAYDDYFTYKGGLEGNTDGEPFTFMRDVRAHGQDVILTLTCDPHVSDEQIRAIAKDLSTYGRLFLRLNHEATGDWFSFNKRASYDEVAAFFVRFTNIIHEDAPNVKMIICIDGVPDLESEEIDREAEFAKAVQAADIWSVDKYLALNWGWPFEIADTDNNQHKIESEEQIYLKTKKTYERFVKICGGVKKPMLISEFNADGDVTGPYKQCDTVKKFLKMVEKDEERWFSGFTMYQFRDDGRLGLEITNPSNPDTGIEQPLFKTYKEIINRKFFMPGVKNLGKAQLPITLRWGNSEDAEGVSMELEFKKDPVFAEVYFDEELIDANLVMELNGKWFYKAPGVKCVDLIPAFFENHLKIKKGETKKLSLKLFAPPASGENDPTQGDDWQENYYYTLTKSPNVRLRFEPIL